MLEYPKISHQVGAQHVPISYPERPIFGYAADSLLCEWIRTVPQESKGWLYVAESMAIPMRCLQLSKNQDFCSATLDRRNGRMFNPGLFATTLYPIATLDRHTLLLHTITISKS